MKALVTLLAFVFFGLLVWEHKQKQKTEAGLAEPVPLSDTMQVLAVLELLRGAGVALEKSELFAFVSVQPPPARKAARMFVSADAAVPSEQFADP